MATAALFFQRFYMRRSFKDYKYYASDLGSCLCFDINPYFAFYDNV